jgi:hypothetical protein
MKAVKLLAVALVLASGPLCGNLFAQSAETAPAKTTAGGPQAVTNQAVINPDVLVITGKIYDATTMAAVKNAKINFDGFGEELIQASIDDNGNYALALNKNELGESIRVIFKIGGYKRFIAKGIDKSQTFVDIDVYLQPMGTEDKSDGNVTYKMNDDPFNPLVIQMQ